MGGEEKDLLKTADDALAKGDAAGAAELYAGVLAQDSGNVAALAGLARSYVRTGAIEQAKQTLALVPDAKHNDAAVAAARAAPEPAGPAPSGGPGSRSPSRPSRWVRSPSSSRRSRPIRSTTRRASISPSP